MIINKQLNLKTEIISDKDKLLDIITLTKKEFLASYSYINSDIYDDMVMDLWKIIINKDMNISSRV